MSSVMRLRGWVRWLTLSVAVVTTVTAEVQRSPAPLQPPRLAVLIVVDQMRADYVDRFRDQWTSGLKRLVTRGAWFSNAAYPYLSTVTCPGHATISTGAFPYRHGVRHNTWFDREKGRVVRCTEDAGTKPIPYGTELAPVGDSAVHLRLPGFADEMRSQVGARVVSLSLKARSAIMLAGHKGDAVTWLSEALDVWETSSAFGEAVPAVNAFVQANPIDADYGKTWDRLLPLERYQFADTLIGEAPPREWTATFPHVLSSASGKPDEIYHTQWERSPFANDFLGRFAAALVESLKLGQRDTTDVLAVSFSSPDLVGHAFGPRSQEVQDMYARLDLTIGALLDRLDAQVGPDRYVVALSADHGVTDIPEQLKESGRDAGRLSSRAFADIIEARPVATAGPGRYLTAISGNDVHFEPGMYTKLAATPRALNAVIRDLSAQPGIARVFRGEDLERGTTSRDTLTRAAALSYVKGGSGELVFALKPGWMVSVSGTTHSSGNADDQRVPMILFGRGVRPGHYRESVTPADIAPTLAALTGITMPNAEGRVLRAALVVPPVAPSTRP
jgi:predicted AlkP superfamily pyrophosphatase or phosphodiesterase